MGEGRDCDQVLYQQVAFVGQASGQGFMFKW